MKLDLQTNLNKKDVRNGGVRNSMKVWDQANINCSNWINIEMIIFFIFFLMQGQQSSVIDGSSSVASVMCDSLIPYVL